MTLASGRGLFCEWVISVTPFTYIDVKSPQQTGRVKRRIPPSWIIIPANAMERPNYPWGATGNRSEVVFGKYVGTSMPQNRILFTTGERTEVVFVKYVGISTTQCEILFIKMKTIRQICGMSIRGENRFWRGPAPPS